MTNIDRTDELIEKVLDFDKIVEAIRYSAAIAVSRKKNFDEATRKKSVVREVLKAEFPNEESSYYISLQNGSLTSYEASLKVETSKPVFTADDLALLAKLGRINITVQIDGDNVTPELVSLLASRLGKKESN